MKRLLLVISVLFFLLPVWAEKEGHSRGISFDANLGAGWTTLGYRLQPLSDWSASANGNYGLNGHLGVNFFFSEYIGLGIGADITRFGETLSLTGRMQWDGVTDTDGEKYCHILDVKKWNEQQQYTYVSPQAMLLFAFPVGSLYLTGGLGAEYGFCLTGSFKGSGDLMHTGYYEPWHLTLSNMPPHGFYETKDFHPSGELTNGGAQVALIGRIGVLIPLQEHLDFMINGIFKYAFMTGEAAGNPKYSDLGIAGGNRPLGFRDDHTGMTEAHYFMNDYTSFMNSDFVGGDIRPLMLGLEIGIRYTLTRKKMHKRVPCLCNSFN